MDETKEDHRCGRDWADGAACGDLRIKLGSLPVMARGLLDCRRMDGGGGSCCVGELVSEQV